MDETEKMAESPADYERRCRFDQPALDMARTLEAVFKSPPLHLRVTKAQIAITELLMRETADRDRLAARVEELEERLRALDDERETLRRRLGPHHSVPDTLYEPKNGEWSIAWSDRFDEEQIDSDVRDKPVRYTASVRVADRWCVMIPLAVEEDGSWDGSELRWFDTEKQAVDAREAAGGNRLSAARALQPDGARS